jgi:hypothetical protein
VPGNQTDNETRQEGVTPMASGVSGSPDAGRRRFRNPIGVSAVTSEPLPVEAAYLALYRFPDALICRR